MSYCTTTEVLDRMGYSDPPGASIIRRVDDAILAASKAIDEDTGRHFTKSTEDEVAVFRVPKGSFMALRVPDLVSVTTLKIDDDADGDFETTIDAADYELDTDHDAFRGWPWEMIRLLDRGWPSPARRTRRIEVTGVWGWEAVPEPINQACSLLAARLAQRSTSAIFGVQSFGELGAQNIRNNDPDYLALIRPYRRVGLA
jgi:hypothetical protein